MFFHLDCFNGGGPVLQVRANGGVLEEIVFFPLIKKIRLVMD